MQLDSVIDNAPSASTPAAPPAAEVSNVPFSSLLEAAPAVETHRRVSSQAEEVGKGDSSSSTLRRGASQASSLSPSIASSTVRRISSFSRPFSYVAEKHVKLTDSGVHTACPKCGRVFGEGQTTPLTLLCGHSLCAICCGKQMEDDAVRCASCHHLTALGGQGLAALRTNYALGGLVCLPLDAIQRMTTSEALDNIGATCAMCLEVYSATLPPYLLACGHSMCETCCTSDIQACPMCRATLQEVTINKPLVKVVEALGDLKHRPAA
eukprot:EG_transcript_11897